MQQGFYGITINVVCVCVMNRVEINFHTFPSFQSFTSNKKHKIKQNNIFLCTRIRNKL